MTPQDEKYLRLFTDLMIDRIKEVSLDWKKPWFPAGDMPRNAKGYYYQGTNSMLLDLISMGKGYAAPVFVSFLQAKELGCHILKGEGGWPTVLYKTVRKTVPGGNPVLDPDNSVVEPSLSPEGEKGERMEREVSYLVLRYNTVFNIDQTNLKEVQPELYEKLVRADGKKVEKKSELLVGMIDRMIDEQSWICPIHLRPSDSAYFASRPGESYIVLPEKKQFYEDERFYGVALHEMAHSTLMVHPRELSYAEEELVAELSSAYSSAKMGIGLPLKEENAQYLKAWMSKISDNPEYLMNVIKHVSKAVDVIDMHVNPEALNKLATNLEIHNRIEMEHSEKMREKKQPVFKNTYQRPSKKKGVRL